MNLTIHQTLLPADDPHKSLSFYRDALGLEVCNDVGYGGVRWITVRPVRQPRTSIVLEPPGAARGLTEDERRTIAELMAQGSYACIVLGTSDLAGTFERVQARGAGVVQEPADGPYGVRHRAFRDCGFRDAAGNLVRINQLP